MAELTGSSLFKSWTFPGQMLFAEGSAFVIHLISLIAIGTTMEEMFVPLEIMQTKFEDTEGFPTCNVVNEAIAYKESVAVQHANPFAILLFVEVFSLFMTIYAMSVFTNWNTLKWLDEKELEGRLVTRRWFDFGVTFPLMNIALLIAYGEHMFFLIVAVFFIVMFMQSLGFLVDSELGESRKNTLHKTLYMMGYIELQLFMQGVIVMKLIETETDYPKLKWALAITQFTYNVIMTFHLCTASWPLPESTIVKGGKRSTSGYHAQFNRTLVYSWTGLAYKESMVWLTYASVRHIIGKINPTEFKDGGVSDWAQVFWTMLITHAALWVVVMLFLLLGKNNQLSPPEPSLPWQFASSFAIGAKRFVQQGRGEAEYSLDGAAFDEAETQPVLGLAYVDVDDEEGEDDEKEAEV